VQALPVCGHPANGGRAMTVGRKPYRGPLLAPAPPPTPASGMPPNRFPAPDSGAALMVLIGSGAAWLGAAAGSDQVVGTDSLPTEAA